MSLTSEILDQARFNKGKNPKVIEYPAWYDEISGILDCSAVLEYYSDVIVCHSDPS